MEETSWVADLARAARDELPEATYDFVVAGAGLERTVVDNQAHWAERAIVPRVMRGVVAAIVSNHGGRLIDGAISTARALPAVVDAVGGDVVVLVDGGIRSGGDVFRALAIGARAVLIGRPYLWALAVDGELGVRNVLSRLTEELCEVMMLSGCSALGDITRDAVTRSP